MLRRSLHTALSLAVVAALLGAGLVGAATPAAAAGFSGTAQLDGPLSTTVGATTTITLDTTGLDPVPTDYEVLWQRQPLGGGTITTVTTQTGTPDPSGVTTLTYTPTVADAGHYLLLTATLRSTVPDPDALYVTYGQVVVPPGSFVPPGALTVTGTARVGQTLTVTDTTAAWSPTPDAVTYTWSDVDTSAVLGTGTSYELTAGDRGRTLVVQALATRAGYTSSAVYSPWIGAVGPGEFVLTAAPAVEGGLRVGRTVTATAPQLSPAPDTITYQWYLHDGTPVVGADEQSLTPTADLIGQSVYVVATATRAHYDPYVAASAPTGAVGLAELSLGAAPQIPSAVHVGTAVTVTAPTFTPSPDSVTYQWYRTPDVLIPGATGTAYTPTTDDVGTQLYVVAKATRASTQQYVVASNLSGAVALAPFTTAPVPTLSGPGIVGTAFTADAHTAGWAPTPTSLTYRWFRASQAQPLGTPIVGATGVTYTATAQDAGSYVYVEVTAHRAGSADHVIGSAPSRTVHLPWVETPDDAGTVTTVPGGRLRVTLHGLLPSTPYDLELHSTPVSLGTVTTAADGTASVDVLVPSGVPAGSHTLVVLKDGTVVLQVPVSVLAAAGTAAAGTAAAGTAAAGTAAVTPTAALASTGAAVAPVLVLALLLVAAGTGVRRLRSAR